MPRPATITLRVSPVTSRLRRPGRRPAAALAVVLVGAAAALAACSTQSPAQTTVSYQPADGVDANLGSVLARGLVLVSAAKDAPGVLVGSLINDGTDPVTVTFLTQAQAQAGEKTGPTMQLKATSQVPISGVQIDSVPAAPGALTTIALSSSAGQVFADVPVLLPDGYYANATATAVPTTATATATSTSTATVTATVTATATTTATASATSTTTGG
ncbi:MAG TPA: hypothetical protein VFR40_04410 [Lapillicoccus sp.]|nr:hypothetical protein [Lapillicoccus sp.]